MTCALLEGNPCGDYQIKAVLPDSESTNLCHERDNNGLLWFEQDIRLDTWYSPRYGGATCTCCCTVLICYVI